MSAADRLAAIRHRHLYDVDLGRWDEDETGMLAALDAVLALCDEAAPRRMGDGYLSASVLAPEDVRAAITDALGGGA